MDMQPNPEKIPEAVARKEPVESNKKCSAAEHPAFGMWADRPEMADPSAYVRELRNGHLLRFARDGGEEHVP